MRKQRKQVIKGQKQIVSCIYESESKHMKGWKFNGITLDKIKVFCHRNGLDKKNIKKL